MRTTVWLTFFALACTVTSFSYEKLIEGNQYFSTRKVKSLILFPKRIKALSKSELFQWKEIAEQEISYEYENFGFFDINVEVVIEQDSTPKKSEWRVIFRLKEGPRFRFGDVILKTTDTSDPLVKVWQLRCRDGFFFNLDIVNRDKRDIEKVYGDMGFVKRRVKQELFIDPERKRVDVVFSINPSYLVVFDTLIIKNRREKDPEGRNGLSDEKLIRDVLNIQKGDTVRLSKTNQFKRKLKSTKVFNYIRLKDTLFDEESEKRALLLLSEERVPGTINASGFWETYDGFGIELGCVYRNLFGSFYEGKVRGRLAQYRQNFYVSLGNPLLFGQQLRLDNEFEIVQRQRTTSLSPFDVLYSTRLTHPISNWVRLSGSVEFENTISKDYISDISSVSIDRARIIQMNLIGSILFSFVNHPFNPSRGVKLSFTLGNGGELLDSKKEWRFLELRHNWGEIKSSYYYPLASWVTAALRLDGGAFSGTGGINSKRFYLGGRKSVRNADFREICPEIEQGKDGLDCVDDIIPIYFLSSYELRCLVFSSISVRKTGGWKVLRNSQIVPFIDYGRIWNYQRSFNSSVKGHAVGIGTRIPIAFFNFRIDYAIGWDKGFKWSDHKLLIDLAQSF